MEEHIIKTHNNPNEVPKETGVAGQLRESSDTVWCKMCLQEVVDVPNFYMHKKICSGGPRLHRCPYCHL